MNDVEFETFVKNRYNKSIEWYDTKSMYNKKLYNFFQSILIIFSALTPVLIAIDFGVTEHTYLKWIAIVIAVIVSVAVASLRIFKFHDNWTTYRGICETLKKEINFFNAGINEYAKSDDRQALFVDRVENLISKEHNLWKTYFRK